MPIISQHSPMIPESVTLKNFSFLGLGMAKGKNAFAKEDYGMDRCLARARYMLFAFGLA